MRFRLVVLLLCASCACVRAAAFEAMPFATDSRQELAVGLNVALDEAGNAQLFWRGDLLLQVELLSADDDGWRRPSGEHRLLRRHWPYFHLDSVYFWQRLDSTQQESARPCALRVRSQRSLEAAQEEIHTHGSVGAAWSGQLEFARMRLPGGRVLAIFDPSGHPLRAAADGGVWTFGGDRAPGWFLAVAVAEDDEILAHDLGQALSSLHQRAHLSEIEPPPLCERCRLPAVEDLKLQLRELGSEWELRAELIASQLDLPHERPLFTTLSIGDLPLRSYLSESSDTRAVYRISIQDARAEELLRELALASPRVRLLCSSGEELAVERFAVTMPPLVAPASGPPVQPEFPRLLSPRLLDASPNPFQESTWLRVTIPSTMDEAFDLDEQLRAKIDPLAAPPFAANPQVRVRVYNVQGKLVKSLFEGVAQPGELAMSWNGLDDAGQTVAAGAYYLNLQIEEYAVTRRITMLKP